MSGADTANEGAGPSGSSHHNHHHHHRHAKSREKASKPKKETPRAASDSRLNDSHDHEHDGRDTHGHATYGVEQVGTAINEPEEEEQQLKYGATHIIHLFVPVSLCMALVVLTMTTVGYYSRNDGVYLAYTPFTKPTDNAGELLVMSLGNALVLLSVVVLMTLALICLYKFRLYRIIHGWLIASSLILLSLFTLLYLQAVLNCLGMLCIHWKGPLRLQQFYLVMMSALMALTFIKYLPDWTVWTVLAALSIWDLVAVLCPKGPLRILVETAQQRNEPIFPALIYSSGIIYLYAVMATTPGGDGNNGTSSTTGLLTQREASVSPAEERRGLRQPHPIDAPTTSTGGHPTAVREQRYAPMRKRVVERVDESDTRVTLRQRDEGRIHAGPSTSSAAAAAHHRSMSANAITQAEEIVMERGIKLGLGDFIFYSVLVGKASSFGDWNTTIACYIAILIGLAFTLMLLALYRKALPALPISIFAGIIFYFATRGLITPFTSSVSIRQYLL